MMVSIKASTHDSSLKKKQHGIRTLNLNLSERGRGREKNDTQKHKPQYRVIRTPICLSEDMYGPLRGNLC